MINAVFKIDLNGNFVPFGGPVPLVGIPAALSFTSSGVNVDAAQIIPLNPTPSQQLDITLSQQACTIFVYTKHIMVPIVPSGGIPTEPPIYEPIDPVFLDLYISGSLLLGGLPCLDRTLLIQNSYFEFIGDMSFIDTQGTTDPVTAGLGSRYQLAYFPNIVGQ